MSEPKQVAAAILVREGRVFLARRRLDFRLGGHWEFPGGKIEPGETPTECLVREFHEEFEMAIEPLHYFDRSFHRYELGAIELQAFWARTEGDPRVLTAHEEFRWFLPEELKGLLLAPADVPLVERLLAEGLPAFD